VRSAKSLLHDVLQVVLQVAVVPVLALFHDGTFNHHLSRFVAPLLFNSEYEFRKLNLFHQYVLADFRGPHKSLQRTGIEV
jgi:hypothetical protein